MTRYLLDTNAWVHLLRNRPQSVRERYAALAPGSALLCPIVRGELEVGWRKGRDPEAGRRVLHQYLRSATPDPLDAAVAEGYGAIRAELERRGETIGANDLWIAAHALTRGCVLVTDNVDEFRRVPGLTLENWARD